MSMFSRFFKWLPSPLKRLRQHLHIQHEWQQFKHHIRPHKLKIYLAIVVISYPLYSPYAIQLKQWTSYKCSSVFNSFLGTDKPAFQVTQNFAKNLLSSIFNDETVKHQGLGFLNGIIQEDQFIRDILNLLISALKNSQFMQSLQGSSKQLTIGLLQDSEIQAALKNSLTNVAQSEEVKQALAKLIQSAFSSEESTRTIVQLLKKGVSNEQVKDALSGTANYAVQQLLKDEQTLNQLKIFIFFLLRKFQNDEEIKSMMDILFAKGLGITKKKKDSDLQKLLKSMDDNGKAREGAEI